MSDYIEETDTSTVIDVFGSIDKVGQDEECKPQGSVFKANDKMDMSGTRQSQVKSTKDKIILAVPKNLIYVGFCMVFLAFWYMLRLILLNEESHTQPANQTGELNALMDSLNQNEGDESSKAG